jgi:glutamate carboxypeptidase
MALRLPPDALAALDEHRDAMIERTVAWASINSGSGNRAGLDRMACHIADALSVLPGVVTRRPLPTSERVLADGSLERVDYADAIELVVRPQAPLQFALTGHYDTVFPADHPFQSVSRRADGALHGPGVADMKGGILVMLAALTNFETAADIAAHVGYTVLLSPDEEVGSPGSAPLLAELGARAHVGMTFEPALADGSLAGARKGSGNYSLIVRGRAAHVGRAFGEGRSAVVAAAEAVTRLHALNGRREGVTVNIGAVDGGSPVNVVPAGAVVRFNVRMANADEREWAEKEIADIVTAIDAMEGIAAHLHGGVTRPPKPMIPAQATLFGWLKQAGETIGVDLRWAPTGGVCEGNNLLAAGCPNIDTLGVCGGAIHSADEFALPDSFVERAKLSFAMLYGFGSGAFDPRSLKV